MTSHDSAGHASPAATKIRLVAVIAVLLLLTGAAVWFAKGKAAEAAKSAGRKPFVTSVATAKVKSGDLDIRIGALGSVTALKTVVVRSRVDGELMKIHFAEGASVNAGDPLADIDPRPFLVQKMQAEGQLARDTASLKNARLDLARYTGAAEAVTRQQIDAATAAVAQFEGAVKTDEAAVDNAKLQIEYCHITAPISGTVGLRRIDAGNIVSASDTGGIVTITQLQPISVIFSVAENDLAALLKAVSGGTALKVEALDRDGKVTLATGTLAALDNQIDPTTGTVKLRANFDNADRKLFPNQFVNVRLLVDTKKGVALAPTTAVQISDKDRFVYVLNNDDTVSRRAVKTGDTDGLDTEIIEGLAPGETVVTDGLDRLQEGAKVIPQGRTRAHAAGQQTTEQNAQGATRNAEPSPKAH